MSPRALRILIPILAGLAAVGVLWVVFNAQSKRSGPGGPSTQPSGNAASSAHQAATSPVESTQPGSTPAAASTSPATSPAASPPLHGLRAMAPTGDDTGPGGAPEPLGSLDRRRHHLRLDFSLNGAGLERLAFSDIWESAQAKRKAQQYFENLPADAPFDPAKLDEHQRYVLQSQQRYRWIGGEMDIPVLAAHSLIVDAVRVDLLPVSGPVWSETGPGQFETRIIDSTGQTILEVSRKCMLAPPYGLDILQRVRNVSGRSVEIRWQQYGPPDLKFDRSGYIDRRRFAIGYLGNPADPKSGVVTGDNDFDYERNAANKLHNKAVKAVEPARKRELLTLWPNQLSVSRGYGLSWFASTNRYFALAIHPITSSDGSNRALSNVVDQIRLVEAPNALDPPTLFTFLISPVHRLEPEATAAFDLGVYAGPLDRDVLREDPYRQLAMKGLILYQMSSCCTFLTFQWLAHLLLGFLSLLHDYILFDWGLAIIALVIVVRSLLHPLTKKSQINMQRFGKRMAAMKPEIDKIQKKFAGDPKKAQQEQMRMMREHGVNPLQMLGCLPMFLQMPIWIALWAMLYLAFDIRQQPAFYGVFQLFNNWSFLSDLSIQDHFIGLGRGFTIPLVGWDVTAINLLPLLMGVVFYIQQKYMSPPPTPNMTPEQIQQQKIMKVMMVVMFPLMLYKAPSGLTLYIFTSTCIGILESRYIRKHIDELDKNPPQPVDRTSKKPKDLRSRLFAAAIERAKAKRNAEPAKTFKKRK